MSCAALPACTEPQRMPGLKGGRAGNPSAQTLAQRNRRSGPGLACLQEPAPALEAPCSEHDHLPAWVCAAERCACVSPMLTSMAQQFVVWRVLKLMNGNGLLSAMQCPYEATLGMCVKPTTCKFQHGAQPTPAPEQYDPANPTLSAPAHRGRPLAAAAGGGAEVYPHQWEPQVASHQEWGPQHAEAPYDHIEAPYEQDDFSSAQVESWSKRRDTASRQGAAPVCTNPRLTPNEGPRKVIKKPERKKEVVGLLKALIPEFYVTEEEKARRALALAIEQDPLNVLPVAERPKVDSETFPHTPLKVRQSVLEKVTRIYVQFFPKDLPRACKEALAEEASIYKEATGESSYRNGSAHRMIALKRRLRATLASRARAPPAPKK